MRVPGAKTARKFSRWMQARLLGGALILGYHRISAAPEDPYEVCVSPEFFDEHLQALKRYTHPVSLSRLVQDLRDGSLRPKTVALTFDDGYADNLYNARPLLEKYEIPATVFVCTGYMGREFWWDELDRLIMFSRADLHELQPQLVENQIKWDPPWVSPEAESPEIRRQLNLALYHFLLSLDVEDQNRAMDTIRSWSGLPSNEDSASRTMDQDELLQLTNGGFIELGAHTRHHPMLPRLSFERQKEEIDSSKRDLEALLGRPVQGFSYPNGRATAEAKRIVREAGFTYACTSLQDVVRSGCDIYELTRFWQQDVNGDKFIQILKSWVKLR